MNDLVVWRDSKTNRNGYLRVMAGKKMSNELTNITHLSGRLRAVFQL